MMHEAFEPHGEQRHYRFRTLDALVRRLGGDSWQVEHDPTWSPPHRTVMVLKRDRTQPSAHHVVCGLRVPADVV